MAFRKGIAIAWLASLLRRLGSIFRIGRASNDDFDPELREVFFAELEEVTRTLEAAFATWRANAADQAALKNLRRGFHTIKGSALLVGSTELGEFCKPLEDLAIKLMEAQVKVTPPIVVTIEQAIGLLPAFAKNARDGRAPPPQAHSIAKRAQRLVG